MEKLRRQSQRQRGKSPRMHELCGQAECERQCWCGRRWHKAIIPGSRAPTVRAPGLLNSMLRLLSKFTDKLSGFLQSFLSKAPCRSYFAGTSLAVARTLS